MRIGRGGKEKVAMEMLQGLVVNLLDENTKLNAEVHQWQDIAKEFQAQALKERTCEQCITWLAFRDVDNGLCASPSRELEITRAEDTCILWEGSQC